MLPESTIVVVIIVVFDVVNVVVNIVVDVFLIILSSVVVNKRSSEALGGYR